MKKTNNIITSTKTLIKDITNIIEGYIEINNTRPVAVYKLFPKLNPIVADDNDVLNAIEAFKRTLTQLQLGEQVQFIIKTKPYNLEKRTKLYEDLAKKAQEELLKNSNSDVNDNYLKNVYPNYFRNWLKEFITINNVFDFEFFMLYSFTKQEITLPTSDITDYASIFVKNKDFLESQRQTFINNIQRFVDIEQLSSEQIINLVEDCINDSTSGNIHERSANLNTIARSGIERFKDYLTIGEDYTKTIYISDLPDPKQSGFLQFLFMSGKRFRLSLFFEGISQEQVKKNLERELKIASTAGASKFTPDYASEELAKRYDELLTASAAGTVSFIKFGLYLTLIEKSLEELNDSFSYIKSFFAGLPLYKGAIEQIPCFKSTLPLNINYAKHSYTVATDEAATTFPFFKYDISTAEGGIMIGTNIINQPVYYYPWSTDFTNGNICVLGIPGSGKSFFNNSLLISLGAWDLDIFIIDKSKSYEFLCKINKGQFLKIDLEGTNCLNVFECIDYDPELAEDNDINEKGEVTANKIASIVGFFKTLLPSKDTSEWQLEKSLIESIIIETYKKMKVKDGRIIPETVPILSDFHRSIDVIIKEKPEWKQQLLILKEKLNPYIGNRQYANLTDRKTTIDIKSSFIVFDTSGLPEDDDLQSLAVYIISTFLTKKFKQNKKKHRRQILAIDETWSLARFDAGIKFLLNLAKRSRHLGLLCVFASQQINDFLGNADASQVLKGTENQIFFKQSKTDLENLQKLFNLNDQERGIIGSLTQKEKVYSEAFLILGKLGSNKIRVIPNAASYWISTTESKFAVPKRDDVLKETNYNYELALQKLTGGE